MNRNIEIALKHSPKHKNDIAAALIGVPRDDIAGAAAIVKAKCEEHRIVDFPNPFPHGSPEALIWGGKDVAAVVEDTSADRDWSSMTKVKIALVLNTEFDQGLDAKAVKKLTKDQLVAKAEELANA